MKQPHAVQTDSRGYIRREQHRQWKGRKWALKTKKVTAKIFKHLQLWEFSPPSLTLLWSTRVTALVCTPRSTYYKSTWERIFSSKFGFLDWVRILPTDKHKLRYMAAVSDWSPPSADFLRENHFYIFPRNSS